MAFDLKRLLPRHHTILDMVVSGLSNREIAAAVGLNHHSVGDIVNSPLFQDALARRRQAGSTSLDAGLAESSIRAQGILSEAAPLAAQRHVDLLESDDDRVAQASANAILDRVLGKGQDHSSVTNVVVLEPGAIQVLQLALAESVRGREALSVVGEDDDTA
jgi:hypothetical protein